MAKRTSISDFIETAQETQLIQADVNKGLVEKVKTKMKRDKNKGLKVSFRALITAAFQKYLEE